MSSPIVSNCCICRCLSSVCRAGYNAAMRTRLVKLGDAVAVRIPPSFIEQASLGKSFHILVEHDQIILRRYKNPRYGWAKAIKEAVRKHGNELTDDDIAWLNAPLGPIPEGGVEPIPKGPGRVGSHQKAQATTRSRGRRTVSRRGK